MLTTDLLVPTAFFILLGYLFHFILWCHFYGEFIFKVKFHFYLFSLNNFVLTLTFFGLFLRQNQNAL